MADGARNKDNGSANRASEEAALSARLKGLGAKLGQAGQAKPVENDSGKYVSDPQAMAKGFRLSTELVAGVIVGAIIGWVFDRLTGLSPWVTRLAASPTAVALKPPSWAVLLSESVIPLKRSPTLRAASPPRARA